MKFSAIASSFSIFGSFAAAKEFKSKPFKLIIESTNKDLNGLQISACHVGAAVESLCLYKTGVDLYLNTTSGDRPVKSFSPPGAVIWDLPAPTPAPSPMRLVFSPSSNVAMSIFFPGYSYEGTQVAFDGSGRMAILDYVDDTVTPPTSDQWRALFNWYICETYYGSYIGHTLAWAMGTSKPQNPSCIKVNVRRKFL